MDLIKIGKYIAEKRKEHDMTQRQVAEKLGMSDKSVSKWERGVCLPDVSVYSDLCQILGISINDFLAGEDIDQENIIKKSEQNIIEVTTDSERKQKRLKMIIHVFLAISILALSVIVIIALYANRPLNYIAPVDPDSTEMETAENLADEDGAHIYKFTTTDEYSCIRLYISEYQSGKLIGKEPYEFGFDGMGSPENGEIFIIPDFNNFKIKVIVVAEGAKYSNEIPILDHVTDREYYVRSVTEINENTRIKYNKEQALLALIYDVNEIDALDVSDITSSEGADALAEDDYVYYFSFEFCKK